MNKEEIKLTPGSCTLQLYGLNLGRMWSTVHPWGNRGHDKRKKVCNTEPCIVADLSPCGGTDQLARLCYNKSNLKIQKVAWR